PRAYGFSHEATRLPTFFGRRYSSKRGQCPRKNSLNHGENFDATFDQGCSVSQLTRAGRPLAQHGRLVCGVCGAPAAPGKACGPVENRRPEKQRGAGPQEEEDKADEAVRCIAIAAD